MVAKREFKCANYLLAHRIEAEASTLLDEVYRIEAEASILEYEATRITDEAARIKAEATVRSYRDQAHRLRDTADKLRNAAERITNSADRVHKIENKRIEMLDSFVNSNRVTNTEEEEPITEFSKLVTDLIITDRLGNINQKQIYMVALEISKVLTYLLELSQEMEETADDSRNKITEKIAVLLKAILLN